MLLTVTGLWDFIDDLNGHQAVVAEIQMTLGISRFNWSRCRSGINRRYSKTTLLVRKLRL